VVNANQMAGDPTSQMTLGLNLPATATNAGAAGTVQSTTVEYFGNLGTSESLTFSFTPVVPATGSSNRWTMQIRDSASADAVIGEYSLTFDDSRAAGGTLQSVTMVSGGAYDPATGTVADRRRWPADPEHRQAGRSCRTDPAVRRLRQTQITKDGSPVGEMNTVDGG
jgi:flagellar hook protein FlgE